MAAANEMDRVLGELLELASSFGGRGAAPDSLVYGDLHINGWDYIEFVEEVEARYGVDLDWMSSRSPAGSAQDASLATIAVDILRQRRLNEAHRQAWAKARVVFL